MCACTQFHKMDITTNNIFDAPITESLDLDRAKLPAWLLDLYDDMHLGLYKGAIFYGNVDDLFPFKSNLYNLETFINNTVFKNVVLGMDPALGVYTLKGSEFLEESLNVGYKGTGSKILNDFLQNIYIKRQELTPAVIMSGVKYWLGNNDQYFNARLVKRILESDAQRIEGISVFIISEMLSDLSHELVMSPYIKKVEIPFPDKKTIFEVLTSFADREQNCFEGLDGKLELAAERLAGVGIQRLNTLLVSKVAKREKIKADELEQVKQRLVEETCDGLIEFIEPCRNLDALHGMDILKEVIRRDIAIWEEGKLNMIPKGYLLTGPVGIGKTFFVESLAGEASVPVVKLNNFRSGTSGETEANLERIFRMLKSMSRCYVFIDEADQAMGSRQSGSDGSSGRVYSMFAQEISSEHNRGKIIWIMATSQPHKLEPDLKRPGRIDLKIPLLPAHNPEEGLRMIMAIAKSKGLDLEDPILEASDFSGRVKLDAENKYILAAVPKWLTPASATVVVDEILRKSGNSKTDSRDLLMVALRDYLPLIPVLVMQEQTRLAVRESSDLRFVPHEFQYLAEVEKPYIVL